MSDQNPSPVSTAVVVERKNDGLVTLLALIVAIAGVVMLVAGILTWVSISSHLSDERITVSEDAERFAGSSVTMPWQAWAEAEVIRKHALEATEGKTYAELDREDPLPQTAMTASFLRASLFTSVVAFGVAALAMGLGLLNILIGIALLRAAKR